MWGTNWHITLGGDAASWAIAGGTIALAAVTAVLAIAAWRALSQLTEGRTDRQVQVLIHLGERWNSEMMSEALLIEATHTKEGLAHLVERAWREHDGWFFKGRAKRAKDRANRELVILLRVPDYFEDLAVLAERAHLDMRDVGLIFKGVVLDEWDLWELAIAKLREGDPYSYTQFERLVTDMRGLPDE
jgi:hypothetical protein